VALSKTQFAKSELEDGQQKFFFSGYDISVLEKVGKIGPHLFARVASDLCIKVISNPGNFLKVVDNNVILPGNIDSASDSLVHRLIVIYERLGITSEMGDVNITIPEFTNGWIANMSYIYEVLYRVISSAQNKENVEMLPTHLNQDIGRVLISMILFKWASRHNMAAYLRDDVKKRGNISEVTFSDLIKGYGTTLPGTIAGRIACAIYQLVGIISSLPGIDRMIPHTMFLSGGDIRRNLAPPRQIIEKKGRDTKIVQKGEINILRFDNVRFLMPKERLAAKDVNESANLEKEIREFDAASICNRDYYKLEALVKDYFNRNGRNYFRLRRLTRVRLHAIKEVRREAKQSDQIPDAEFNSDDFIDSVKIMAESLIADITRKSSILERLSTDILSFTSEGILPSLVSASH
jgi:hypothetical protein